MIFYRFIVLEHCIICMHCMYVLEGARASTGLSLLCVNVGYKHWSNDSNSNMQPITIKFAVRVGLYLYIILSASCTVDIIDQGRIMDTIIHWLHIYPLCEIFYFRAIDNWVMFKLTGLNYFRLFPSGLP